MLKIISHPVTTNLEITEISRRFIQNNGPALLFQNVIKNDGTKSEIPVLTNLFADHDRIAFGLGLDSKDMFDELGNLLTLLRYPSIPASFIEKVKLLPKFKRILSMSCKFVSRAKCQEVIIDKPDLSILPIQTCWPNDISPLITWPLVVTRDVLSYAKTSQEINNHTIENTDEKTSKDTANLNIGIYRMQVLGNDKLIVRWLKMRGGAAHFNNYRKLGISKMPISVVIGCTPSVILSAVMPLPNDVSEYNFAGLLQNKKIEVTKCITNDLVVPSSAEIVIEGEIDINNFAMEGPFGDHTGYYNDVEEFPVMRVKMITMRKNPIYLSTYTGKPPDEPSILGTAFNNIFIPMIRKQFSEITDFHLPEEGCSYRFAVISIKKTYPGQAKRIMMGVWSFLQQFMYTKYIIIVDEDINIRCWKDVIWAISTRADPARDTTLIDNTPIDYLDFASKYSSLGGKMGIDATNKIYPETNRKWGEKISMDPEVIKKIDKIWENIYSS